VRIQEGRGSLLKSNRTTILHTGPLRVPHAHSYASPNELLPLSSEPFTSRERRMIKVIYCFRRRPDMDDAAFNEYWQHVHGPIGAQIPGLRRLVQSRALRIPGDSRAPDFDGVVELWFDDEAALLRARSSPEWMRSGLDEPNFLDPESTAYLAAVERTIELPGDSKQG
jgi:uncharacterized protein (TIGR02118 family)